MNKVLPKVTIISTGSEFTAGKSIDTNSAWLAGELFELGFQVEKFLVLPDSFKILKNNISEELIKNKTNLIIMTGGLGPTEDDCTLDVIASIFSKKTIRFEKSYQRLENLYKTRGEKYLELISKVEKQTRIPEGAIPLENNIGIAAGFMIQSQEQSFLIALPGVPAEMKPMFKNEVIDLIDKFFPKNNIFYDWRWIWGIGESLFQDKFIEVNKKLLDKDVTWGVTAKHGYIKVSFQSSNQSKINNLIQKMEKEFIGYITNDIFADIHKYFTDEKKTLGTAESCTGGLISKKLTDTPGSSAYFLGSIISYSNEIKNKLLDVKQNTLIDFGSVSQETATEMIFGLEQKLNCDYSISITGIAGPGGETLTKKVGLCFIGIKKKEKDPVIYKFHFPFSRELFREYASNTALFCLYKQILQRNL